MQQSRLAAAALAVAALAFGAPPAFAEISDQQAADAAARGAAWIRAQQTDDGRLGFFGGDWAMIALANAGVHAADVRAGALNPSVQDFYVADWTGDFSLEGSAVARGLLAGRAGGIQTARLSARENLVAKLAAQFDGAQLGSTALVNDDMFGVLGLERAGAASAIAPRLAAFIRDAQTGDGGWAFSAKASKADVDMTGAGIAALCAAGAGPVDPAVEQALAYLDTTQDEASGGFASAFFGPNVDSTAWVVAGLRQCGLDPQSPRWTTSAGKTPLDYLVALQRDDGAFRWRAGDSADNLYATQDAITALAGNGFGADPPQRADAGAPRLRPAPDVPAGTEVPLTLVLDHDPDTAGADRICALRGAVGAPLAEVLAAAATTAAPAGCVSSLTLDGDGVASVNGVDEQGGAFVWQAALDGAEAELSDAVDLGGEIALRLAQAPASGEDEPPASGEERGPGNESPAGEGGRPDAPSPLPTQRGRAIATPTPRAILARGASLRLDRRGRVRIAIRCPRGLGATPCTGLLRLRYRAAGRLRTAGSAPFTIASGQRELVRVKLGPRPVRLVTARGSRRVHIEAAVRDPASGATSVSRSRARLRLLPRNHDRPRAGESALVEVR